MLILANDYATICMKDGVSEMGQEQLTLLVKMRLHVSHSIACQSLMNRWDRSRRGMLNTQLVPRPNLNA